jgi:hypothetical protein
MHAELTRHFLVSKILHNKLQNVKKQLHGQTQKRIYKMPFPKQSTKQPQLY